MLSLHGDLHFEVCCACWEICICDCHVYIAEANRALRQICTQWSTNKPCACPESCTSKCTSRSADTAFRKHTLILQTNHVSKVYSLDLPRNQRMTEITTKSKALHLP